LEKGQTLLFDQEENMARRSLIAGLIVLHLLTIVHVTAPGAQEEWHIRHQEVLSAQPNQPIGIEAELEGRTTGILMYIMARKTGQKDFRSFAMSAAGGALFQGRIPAKWVTTEGLEYYIRLQDPIGRLLARYPEDETFIDVTVSAGEPEEMAEEPAAAPEEPETTPDEMAEAPPGEPEPEKTVAETPPRKPAVEEEPAVPPEKPEIVMEEKKGGLKTWHWMGLGALAVVGIAAVAMSGGDDGGGDGRTPANDLPDPPDHP
jgi:hypothetical protein